MTNIIRRLLDFTRRQAAPQQSQVDMQDLVVQVLAVLDFIAKERGVAVEFQNDAGTVTVMADATQIQQVLMNLVMNGIQAMPDGGKLEVGLRLERVRSRFLGRGAEQEYLALYVKDEGEGISEENKERVFEPFFTTRRAGEGTGLGLSVAYGIVEEHGGWIGVESELGKGACFTVYLPLESSQCPDES